MYFKIENMTWELIENMTWELIKKTSHEIENVIQEAKDKTSCLEEIEERLEALQEETEELQEELLMLIEEFEEEFENERCGAWEVDLYKDLYKDLDKNGFKKIIETQREIEKILG